MPQPHPSTPRPAEASRAYLPREGGSAGLLLWLCLALIVYAMAIRLMH